MTTEHQNISYREFVKMFDNFFRKGTVVSTYKPVFLRALTDIGRYGDSDLIGKQWIQKHKKDRINVQLDFIAVRFIKYYWDMEVAFGMRHIPERMASTDKPKEDINILRIIREMAAKMYKQKLKEIIDGMDSDSLSKEKLCDEIHAKYKSLKPPTLMELSRENMKDFRELVIKKSIKQEVLKNLLRDMPRLYETVRGKNYIILDAGLVQFMRDTAPIIKKALNYTLALHLERHNPAAKYIATKINDEIEFEQTLEKIRRLEIQTTPEKRSASVLKEIEHSNIAT